MRRSLLLSLLLVLPFTVGGGAVREWVLDGVPFPDTVVAVIDVSASMHEEGPGGRLKCAYAQGELARVCRKMSDQGRLLVARFSDEYEEDPQGWIELPDKEKVERALRWANVRCHGMTFLSSAVRSALAHEESPLGVVVFTDGQATERDTVEAVKEANARRASPAVVGVVGVDPKAGEQTARGLAEGGGGAYVRVVGR